MNRMITFENLNNIRDLGGLRGAGGRRIRPGKLFRGGNLNGASEADIEKLSGMLEIVVDFRTEGEIREKPDPEIPGVFNWHLPVLQTLTEGVTREKDADAHAFMKFMADPDAAFHYMCKTYEHVAKSPFACEQQKRLLEKLLNPGEKGVLWHCTAGKDRTGGFAAIIEEILGVSRDDIVEDYLLTNEGNHETIEQLVAHFLQNPKVDRGKAEPALRAMFEAREEYIMAFYTEAERLYGDIDTFLYKALGVDDALKGKLRELYLEQ